jgi:Aldo/keto reductase family
MQYARLGASGLKVSRVCLGMMSYGSKAERRWHLGKDDAEPIVRRAVEAGVTFFDTADSYSDGLSEQLSGRLLARLFPEREGVAAADPKAGRFGVELAGEVLLPAPDADRADHFETWRVRPGVAGRQQPILEVLHRLP